MELFHQLSYLICIFRIGLIVDRTISFIAVAAVVLVAAVHTLGVAFSTLFTCTRLSPLAFVRVFFCAIS